MSESLHVQGELQRDDHEGHQKIIKWFDSGNIV